MMKRTLIYRIAMLVYLVVVGYLCFARIDGIQSAPLSIFGIASDKVVHFLMFLPFAPLAFLCLGRKAATPVRAVLVTLAIFLVGCVIAGATEVMQGWTGYRTSDPRDFVADTLALALGSVAVIIMEARKKDEE